MRPRRGWWERMPRGGARGAAMTDAFRRWRRMRALGWGLIALGPVMAISHMFEHAGALRLMAPWAQDVFIGYPMAVVLVIAGLNVLARA